MFSRLKDERGFTLVELLVVVLIIGILAAIALPTFLGQREKGQDAAAQSAARNAVSQMESCAADDGGSYVNCGETVVITAKSGLVAGTGAGEVKVTSPSKDGYIVTGYSASGRQYVYTRDNTATPPVKRTVAGTGARTGQTW